MIFVLTANANTFAVHFSSCSHILMSNTERRTKQIIIGFYFICCQVESLFNIHGLVILFEAICIFFRFSLYTDIFVTIEIERKWSQNEQSINHRLRKRFIWKVKDWYHDWYGGIFQMHDIAIMGIHIYYTNPNDAQLVDYLKMNVRREKKIVVILVWRVYWNTPILKHTFQFWALVSCFVQSQHN